MNILSAHNASQATELIDCLRELTPYVIIDCSSYIVNDILSAIALMEQIPCCAWWGVT